MLRHVMQTPLIPLAELLEIVVHSDLFMCSKGNPGVLELVSLLFGCQVLNILNKIKS